MLFMRFSVMQGEVMSRSTQGIYPRSVGAGIHARNQKDGSDMFGSYFTSCDLAKLFVIPARSKITAIPIQHQVR